MEHFKSNATSHNGDLFWALRRAIAQKLNIDPHQGRYVGYLTRRIRRLIADGNLRGVQAKQITMPLIIPMTLQAYITDELGYQYDDLPDDALSLLLIPAHDPSKYDPATATLPSLRDTVNESGNIRYWLITNRSMWAGRHRLLDEVAELLLALFTWLARTGVVLHRNEPTNLGTDNPECLWHLAQIFRRRLVLPETSNTLERGQVLPEREARLFRAWALSSPPGPESYRSWDDNELHNSQDELTEEGDVADELFWKDGDQGTWDNEEGVPVWRD